MSFHGEPRRPSRLGPCTRLRRNAVADAATGQTRVCYRHWPPSPVRRFIRLSANALGWGEIIWEGGLETGRRSDTGVHRGAD